MAHAAYTVIGALFGAVAALLYHFYLASGGAPDDPQLTVGWLAFYAGICLPWAAIGAVVGFATSRLHKAKP